TSGAGFELEGGPALLYYLLSFLYYILMEAFMGGTVGKLALGMRVELEDGSPITIGASIIRNLLRFVDFLPFAYILGMIMISTSPLKQRLGDRVAKTVVIKK
ncbi:MAG: RDD family protein, partial [Dethiobacteria bacterium]|nr:RDD family protein [Dethiobacteria bacterium]